MQERILTAEQVAQILQVHPFTVLKFIKQGKLQASKLGRVYRIREKDLEHFLDHTSGRNMSDTSRPQNERHVENLRTSGRTPKISDSDQSEATTTVLKIKNKNKSPQILEQSKKQRADSGQKKTSNQESDQVDSDQKEVIVTGGDDHYFILK